MANGCSNYKKKLLVRTPGIHIWLVNGRRVRRDHIGFVGSDNDQASDWIPKGEVWIDDNLHKSEYVPVIIEQLCEREFIKQGMSQPDAYTKASKIERKARHDPHEAKRLFKDRIKPYYCTKCKDKHHYKDKYYRKHTHHAG